MSTDKKARKRPEKKIMILGSAAEVRKQIIEARKIPIKTGRKKGYTFAVPGACNPQVIQTAKEAAAKGLPDYVIAALLGINPSTMVAWATKHPEFRAAIVQSRAEFISEISGYERDIYKGDADPFKYPEVRRKAISAAMDRLFPEHVRQATIILSQSPTDTPQTEAQKQWAIVKQIIDGTITKDVD